MNICFFSYEHISGTRGGTERVTEILARSFESKGHRVYMVSVCPPIENDILKENQYILPKIEIETIENVSFIKIFLIEKAIDIILNQAVPKEVLALIVKANNHIPIITCIHTHPLVTIKSITDFWDRKKMNNKWKFRFLYPFIYLAFLSFKRNAKRRTKEYLSFFQKNCDAVVLLSNKYKDCVIDMLGRNVQNLYAIPNPKDLKNVPIISKENTIIFVGRLEFQKRVDRLLLVWGELFNKHKDWKLQIIGEGDCKIFFEQLAQKNNLKNIEFIGHSAPEEYYKKAAIMCMTSTHEGLPMVLLEALQYNVIPVAFNSFESATDIIIDKENGFLIKPFSLKEYAKILDKLMSNAEYRNCIQRQLQEKQQIALFNKNSIVKQWEKLFEELKNKENSK